MTTRLTMPLGVYVPGKTVIHKMRPGWKFAITMIFITVVAFVARDPLSAGIAAGIVAFGYFLARIPVRIALGQLLPILPVLLLLGAYQWWQRGWELAFSTVVGLLATIAAAALLTLTTTMDTIIDTFESALRPFSRVGIPSDTIALAMALTIRMIPLQAQAVQEVIDARKARGLGFSLLALGIPVIILAMKRARELGEALIARGVGD